MLFLKIFKVILIDFVTKTKKSTKSTILEYKEYNFGVQRVQFWSTKSTILEYKEYTRKFAVAKKKKFSYVLERVQSGHPASKSYPKFIISQKILLDPAKR
jgi:hypothetical protein